MRSPICREGGMGNAEMDNEDRDSHSLLVLVSVV